MPSRNKPAGHASAPRILFAKRQLPLYNRSQKRSGSAIPALLNATLTAGAYFMHPETIAQWDRLLNEILCRELAKWLEPKLLQIHGQSAWWSQGVLRMLSQAQQARMPGSARGALHELDLESLLQVTARNFKKMAEQCGVPQDLKIPLAKARLAQHAFARRKGALRAAPEEQLRQALNIQALLRLIQAAQSALNAADKLIQDIGRARIAPEKQAAAQLAQPPPEPVGPAQALSAPKPASQPADWITPTETAREPARTDALPDGLQAGLLAELHACRQTEPGTWIMELRLAQEQEPRRLPIPAYFSASAQAAADIMAAVADRAEPPAIYIKLINIGCQAGQLAFPADPHSQGSRYPLLVVQPFYLINVTALTHFDFCPRNYLLERYSFKESNAGMRRGVLLHNIFACMLRQPGDQNAWRRQCHLELDQQLPDLTMQQIKPRELYTAARGHLNALTQIDQMLAPRTYAQIFSERYMLNPDLGLQGKIDALVQKQNGHWQALELKTGKSWGHKANSGHAFQVSAYHLMLWHAGLEPLDPPAVLYTGNQAARMHNQEKLLPSHSMQKLVPFDATTAINLLNIRNELVRIDYAGRLAFNANPRKCQGCGKHTKSKQVQCVTLHKLGLDGGTPPAKELQQLIKTVRVSAQIRQGFQAMHQALLQELQAIRTTQGQAMQESSAQRIAAGICLKVQPDSSPPSNGCLRLKLENNRSEFREGEPCLLSDAEGPVKGNCVGGFIRAISATHAEISLPSGVQALWFTPLYLDRHLADATFEKNFAGAYALWIAPGADTEGQKEDTLQPIRQFLSGRTAFRPNLSAPTIDLAGINPRPLAAQCKALSLAQGLQDILLVQGPPGTGKTYTLALMVKALAQQGRKIAIATYTHRAADEVINKLSRLAPELELRKLGRPESMAAQHADKCLTNILRRPQPIQPLEHTEGMLADLETRQRELENLLRAPAVYIGTTHAWFDNTLQQLPLMLSTNQAPYFDVVVVDEANQIITPNLAGVLRLAKRWVLVGDHRQLSPIVSGDSTQQLRLTLFQALAEQPLPGLIVQLDEQHRMPPVLADYISQTFYAGRLRTAASLSQRAPLPAHTQPLLSTAHAIALIDIASTMASNHSKRFPAEAHWIVQTIQELQRDNWPLCAPNGKPTLGVIAPYRAQVALLRRLLERACAGIVGPGFWHDVVDTVDRFQGDERDIILFSLCLWPGADSVGRIYEDERRINVALSRAKRKLWVVGSLAAMERIPALQALGRHVRAHPREGLLLEAE